MRNFLEIFIQGKNVTEEISADVLSFTYTDNSHGEADDISLELKDEKAKYLTQWTPTLGDKIQAIITMNDGSQLDCGMFKLDDFTCSGPPTKVAFNAVSVPNTKSIRQTKNTKAWQDVKLQKIAEDTAQKAELKLTYATEINPDYDRIDQRQETDLAFLKRVCEDEGLSLKITSDQIVVFDRWEQEKKAPLNEISRLGGTVLAWSASMQNNDTASQTTVKYTDPKTGKTQKAEAGNKDETGNEQKIKKRVKSKEQAERLAKAKQKEKQANEFTFTISVIGDVFYRAGNTVTIKDFGKFDGTYYIKKVTHKFAPYTCELELSKNVSEVRKDNKN